MKIKGNPMTNKTLKELDRLHIAWAKCRDHANQCMDLIMHSSGGRFEAAHHVLQEFAETQTKEMRRLDGLYNRRTQGRKLGEISMHKRKAGLNEPVF